MLKKSTASNQGVETNAREKHTAEIPYPLTLSKLSTNITGI